MTECVKARGTESVDIYIMTFAVLLYKHGEVKVGTNEMFFLRPAFDRATKIEKMDCRLTVS